MNDAAILGNGCQLSYDRSIRMVMLGRIDIHLDVDRWRATARATSTGRDDRRNWDRVSRGILLRYVREACIDRHWDRARTSGCRDDRKVGGVCPPSAMIHGVVSKQVGYFNAEILCAGYEEETFRDIVRLGRLLDGTYWVDLHDLLIQTARKRPHRTECHRCALPRPKAGAGHRLGEDDVGCTGSGGPTYFPSRPQVRLK